MQFQLGLEPGRDKVQEPESIWWKLLIEIEKYKAIWKHVYAL